MPYNLRKVDGRYCVFNKDTGENKGCSDSRAKGLAHMRAMYAAEGGAKMGKKEIDELVTKAVEEFESEYPEEHGVSPELATKEKLALKGWVPYGLTSFDALDAFRAVQEEAEELYENTSDLIGLITNITSDSTIKDKTSAIKAVADEFSRRMPVIDGAPDEADETKEVADKDEGFIKRIAERVVKSLKEFFADVAPDHTPDNMMIWKESSGQYRWFARYSNNFRDNDNPPEIISEKSHRRFAEMVDKGVAPYPELWLWHVPEWKVGQADWVAYDDSGFALAAGYFNKGQEHIAEWLMKQKDVLVSHGMPPGSIKRDENDPSVLIEHQTVEISPLPAWAAANKLTGFVVLGQTESKEVDEMIPDTKRKALVEKWGINPKFLDELETANAHDAQKAVSEGVESKEVAEVEAEAPVAETVATEEAPAAPVEEPATAPAADMSAYPTREEIVDALTAVLTPMKDGLDDLRTQVETIAAQVKEVKQSDEEKVTKAASNIPIASISAMLASRAIGAREAQVKENSNLAKAKPKEAAKPGNIGVPFLDKMISGAQADEE